MAAELTPASTPPGAEVRDVQPNPHYSDYFGAGLENGHIELWDVRKNGRAVSRMVAHDRLVLALRWHPSDPNCLASGGRDGAIHVWDLSKQRGAEAAAAAGGAAGRPEFSIRTQVPGASVSRLGWRPRAPNSIASCAGVNDCAIHVWDGSRPYLPLASFDHHRNDVTSFFWAPERWGGGGEAECLVSASRDGTVRLNWMELPHAEGGPRLPYRCIRTLGTSWALAAAAVEISGSKCTREPARAEVAGPGPQPEADGRAGQVGKVDGWLQEQQLCVCGGGAVDRDVHLTIARLPRPPPGSGAPRPTRQPAPGSPPRPPPPQFFDTPGGGGGGRFAPHALAAARGFLGLRPSPRPAGLADGKGHAAAAPELGFDYAARNYVLNLPRAPPSPASAASMASTEDAAAAPYPAAGPRGDQPTGGAAAAAACRHNAAVVAVAFPNAQGAGGPG
jgi:hypothetical protein